MYLTGNYARRPPTCFCAGLDGFQSVAAKRNSLLPAQLAWPLNLYGLTSQLTLLEEVYPLEARGLVPGYYQELLTFITNSPDEGGLGHTLDENFWVFAYDWRQSCRISGHQLQKFIIEKLAAANAYRTAQNLPAWQSVDIINHSMGGLVTRVAISSFVAPVERVVYIGSGDYGIAKAFFALHHHTVPKLVDEFVSDFLPGWYWDLLKALPNIWLMQNWLIRLLGTFQAMYELLPDNFYLDDSHNLIVNAANEPVFGSEATYFNDVWQLAPAQQGRVRQAIHFKEMLGQALPGDKNLLIYCDNLPTYTYAHFTTRLEYPVRSNTGDGTVPGHSINRDIRAARVLVEGLHSQLPDFPATHQAIREFLPLVKDIPSPVNTEKIVLEGEI